MLRHQQTAVSQFEPQSRKNVEVDKLVQKMSVWGKHNRLMRSNLITDNL